MQLKQLTAPSEFQPITIQITFESQDEINSLWNRLNIDCTTLLKTNEYYNEVISELYENNLNIELWNFLNNNYTTDTIGISNLELIGKNYATN